MFGGMQASVVGEEPCDTIIGSQNYGYRHNTYSSTRIDSVYGIYILQ